MGLKNLDFAFCMRWLGLVSIFIGSTSFNQGIAAPHDKAIVILLDDSQSMEQSAMPPGAIDRTIPKIDIAHNILIPWGKIQILKEYKLYLSNLFPRVKETRKEIITEDSRYLDEDFEWVPFPRDTWGSEKTLAYYSHVPRNPDFAIEVSRRPSLTLENISEKVTAIRGNEELNYTPLGDSLYELVEAFNAALETNEFKVLVLTDGMDYFGYRHVLNTLNNIGNAHPPLISKNGIAIHIIFYIPPGMSSEGVDPLLVHRQEIQTAAIADLTRGLEEEGLSSWVHVDTIQNANDLSELFQRRDGNEIFENEELQVLNKGAPLPSGNSEYQEKKRNREFYKTDLLWSGVIDADKRAVAMDLVQDVRMFPVAGSIDFSKQFYHVANSGGTAYAIQHNSPSFFFYQSYFNSLSSFFFREITKVDVVPGEDYWLNPIVFDDTGAKGISLQAGSKVAETKDFYIDIDQLRVRQLNTTSIEFLDAIFDPIAGELFITVATAGKLNNVLLKFPASSFEFLGWQDFYMEFRIGDISNVVRKEFPKFPESISSKTLYKQHGNRPWLWMDPFFTVPGVLNILVLETRRSTEEEVWAHKLFYLIHDTRVKTGWDSQNNFILNGVNQYLETHNVAPENIKARSFLYSDTDNQRIFRTLFLEVDKKAYFIFKHPDGDGAPRTSQSAWIEPPMGYLVNEPIFEDLLGLRTGISCVIYLSDEKQSIKIVQYNDDYSSRVERTVVLSKEIERNEEARSGLSSVDFKREHVLLMARDKSYFLDLDLRSISLTVLDSKSQEVEDWDWVDFQHEADHHSGGKVDANAFYNPHYSMNTMGCSSSPDMLSEFSNTPISLPYQYPVTNEMYKVLTLISQGITSLNDEEVKVSFSREIYGDHSSYSESGGTFLTHWVSSDEEDFSRMKELLAVRPLRPTTDVPFWVPSPRRGRFKMGVMSMKHFFDGGDQYYLLYLNEHDEAGVLLGRYYGIFERTYYLVRD